MKTEISKIRWRRVLFAGVLVPLLSLVVLFLILTVYATILAFQVRGQPDQAQIALVARQIAPWVSPLLTIGGVIWVVRKGVREASLNSILVGVVAAFTNLVISFLFGGTLDLRAVVSFVLIVLAGWLGGRVSGRGQRNQRETTYKI